MSDDKKRQQSEREIIYERIEKGIRDDSGRDRHTAYEEDRQITRDELPPELGPGDDTSSDSDN
jgi:hypothetical protein